MVSYTIILTFVQLTPVVCHFTNYDIFSAVTIYVKKDEEKVYNALMLKQLTVKELVSQVVHIYT